MLNYIPDKILCLYSEISEVVVLKGILKGFMGFFREYWGGIFAVLALLIPDLLLRFLVWPKVDDIFFTTVVPTLFNLAWIGLILFGSAVFLPKKWGRLLYIVIGSVFIVFAFAQYVYFGIFDQFFRLISIGLVGEGGDYLDYALSHIDAKLILSTLASIACLVLGAVKWKTPQKNTITLKLFALVPVAVISALHIFMQPSLFGESESDWDAWKKPRVIYQEFVAVNKSMDIAGIYHFVARDFYKTWIDDGNYGKEDFAKVENFFEKKAQTTKKNEYTGALEGKNVIAVMLEGIDDWQIDEKYTPTIKYMMKNGINFGNHHAPTFGTGYTLGTEFCFNTGYYTPISAVSAVNYVSNRFPDALPKLFKEKGYKVNSFHYNNAEFYNRSVFHHSLGYEKYHSFQDYGLPFYVAQADSNILKTEEIYEDMVAGKPFFSFVITYSGHIPYSFEDAKLALASENHPDLVDPEMDTEENACRLLARDTDDFFRQLLESLERDGLLEDTVIVVYTDHYAYGFSDRERLQELNREVGDEILYRVPAFIYTPGLETVEVTKPTGTADLLPTLINLFGLENRHSYIGSDILSADYEGFVYFEDGSWMMGDKHYAPSEEQDISDEEWVQEGNRRKDELCEINEIVIMGDYFSR